ncbi:tannase and feruloyl esterase [Mollisia scopiformis]|uniref:Carboxylic ester hydrolase n=1 Tax=Mollisia scopiformis TaxID=149040 RepID=A0A194X132_MOLSC|nr:tannase and feruloyl esterase [Mollisia scopiformis]KUJ13898.1 tannase and feruloyl esterase [Mollisia scopiformis]
MAVFSFTSVFFAFCWLISQVGGSAICNFTASSLSFDSDTTVLSTTFYSNGSTIPLPGTVASCAINSTIATGDLCRITLNVQTSCMSSIFLEAWLPTNWNGRFLASGTGGIGGCVDYTVLQSGVQQGFATLGQNAGHNGSTGFDFFLNNRESLIDFGYRSTHIEAVTGRQLVEQYYGKPATKNYYMGCSTGGRQAFKTAMMYPEDFDGMLAGSPGVDWLRVVSSKGILAGRIGWPDVSSPAYLSDDQWTAIVAEQIKQCDGLDGVIDGILDDPTKCGFNPETCACGTGVLNNSVCLNPYQVNSVRQAYLPIADTKGDIVYPAWDYGVATDVFSKYPTSYAILSDYFRGAIYNNSDWNSSDFTAADMDFAVKVNPGSVNTGESDLSAFFARGGKLMAYHGRNDNSVTSRNSENYFNDVQRTLNLTITQIHSFYRLFFIPGMHHCTGGPGAWDIGQNGPVPTDMLTVQDNALMSLVEWVESGVEPESLVGTKYTDDNHSMPVLAQRAHCVYPNVSVWDGIGDTKVASSWNCRLPS